MMLQRYPGRLFKKCTNAAITETNASTAFCVPFLAYICPHSKYNSSIIYEKHLMRLFLLNYLLLLSICVVRAQERSDFISLMSMEKMDCRQVM